MGSDPQRDPTVQQPTRKEFAMPAKKQITKDMILQAALQLLRTGGFDAVNVKTLAKELHCSTQPVYLSFSSMDELRQELIPLAVSEFAATLSSRSSDGQVRLYGAEYLTFAENEPRLFCFLMMRPNAFTEMKRALSPIIDRSVRELMETYSISMEEADLLHDHLWMHAHGIASMIATEFCDWDPAKARRMLEECMAVFTAKYSQHEVTQDE